MNTTNLPTRRHARHFLLAAAMVLAPLVASLEAHANRALLIGIGQYQPESPLRDLPGIDVDLENMGQVAQVMGFDSTQIRVLRDHEATAAQIRAEIEHWLIEGTEPGDRVLLYFSGHGVRVPDAQVIDEPDGYDEALAGYDLRLEPDGSEQVAAGIVRDDELHDLLLQLAGREVMVILDACHSATATRAGIGFEAARLQRADGWVRKGGALARSGTAHPDTDLVQRTWMERRDAQHWISLAAAEDAQSAYATSHGSLFTQALHATIMNARSQSPWLAPNDLQAGMTEQLRARFGEQSWVPLPVLEGPVDILAKGIRLTDPGQARPVRMRLEALALPEERQLIRSSQHHYAIGEPVQLEFTAPGDGHFNLIAVDALDQPRLLFPNGWHPENRVTAGQSLTLGAPVLGFRLEASAPAGESYLLAVFTDETQPLNFYREALAEFGERAGVDRGLAKLSSSAMMRAKGIRVTPVHSAYTAQGLAIAVGE
ncbi:MAG: caspase family protein [Gammaproteobacteria bacterium]|nr:caspase family protein [Gammaproteobacteria bacterium]